MEKKELESLVAKKKVKGETQTVSARVPSRVVDKLEKKGIDIGATIQNLLERLAES